jgi:hypothetical protein
VWKLMNLLVCAYARFDYPARPCVTSRASDVFSATFR